MVLSHLKVSRGPEGKEEGEKVVGKNHQNSQAADRSDEPKLRTDPFNELKGPGMEE